MFNASVGRIGALSKIIIIDGIRCYVVLGLLLLALGAEISSLFFYRFIPRNIDQFACDFVLSIGWMIGLLFLFFHSVQTVSWGGDNRTIQAVLARPLSRANYVFGLFIGLALLLSLLNFIIALLGLCNILFIKNAAGSYFQNFSYPFYILSWAGLLGMELMILSAILFFSSIMRGSFPVLLLTICYYFTCNGLPVVRETLEGRLSADSGFVRLLQWMTLIFPDFSRHDYREFIINSQNLPSAFLLISNFSYAILYSVFFLYMAGVIYQQRDLS